MAIVSSAITLDRNHGFARFVEETHTDSLGAKYVRRRFVPQGYNAVADLVAHAAELAEQLAAAEFEGLVNG